MQHDACPQLCILRSDMPVGWPQASTAWVQNCMLAERRTLGARFPSAVCCMATQGSR